MEHRVKRHWTLLLYYTKKYSVVQHMPQEGAIMIDHKRLVQQRLLVVQLVGWWYTPPLYPHYTIHWGFWPLLSSYLEERKRPCCHSSKYFSEHLASSNSLIYLFGFSSEHRTRAWVQLFYALQLSKKGAFKIQKVNSTACASNKNKIFHQKALCTTHRFFSGL